MSVSTADLIPQLLPSLIDTLVDFADEEEKIADLQALIAMLLFPNYCLLRAVIAHLILIVQHASENKMTMRNVGIVLSPILQVPAGVLSLMLSKF